MTIEKSYRSPFGPRGLQSEKVVPRRQPSLARVPATTRHTRFPSLRRDNSMMKPSIDVSHARAFLLQCFGTKGPVAALPSQHVTVRATRVGCACAAIGQATTPRPPINVMSRAVAWGASFLNPRIEPYHTLTAIGNTALCIPFTANLAANVSVGSMRRSQ